MTTQVKPHECPCCGRVNTHTTPVNCEGSPKPGDISICVGCGAINEFSDELQLRVVPDATCAQPDMADARAAQKRVRIARGIDKR